MKKLLKGRAVLFSIIFLLIFFISGIQAQFLGEIFPDAVNRKKVIRIVLAESVSYAAGFSFLYFVCYKDSDMVPFHYYDDSKGYLQIDKFGHTYSAYQQSYASYYALRKAGVSKKTAFLYGGTLGLIFQTPMEISDGLYEGWGFSLSDMLANTLESALLISQEAYCKFNSSPYICTELWFPTNLLIVGIKREFGAST